MTIPRITTGQRSQPVPQRRYPPPPVSEVFLHEDTRFQPDGMRHYGIFVDGVMPTYYDGTVEVWYQRSVLGTSQRWEYGGSTLRLPFFLRGPDVAVGDTYRVAVVTRSFFGVSVGPEASPTQTITLTGVGATPPDVTGFGATPFGGGIFFDWDPVDATTYPYVVGYEIRAGSTGWLSATVVGNFSPRNCPWAWVPRSQAAGTSFYIKAVSYSEDYSLDVGTATITAAGAACLDTSSLVEYQEVTILAGSTSVAVTTVCPYDSAPYLLAGPSGQRAIRFGWGTWSQNPDLTWSATLYASAVAPTGGWLAILHGAGT